jgi:hypothetical protein
MYLGSVADIPPQRTGFSLVVIHVGYAVDGKTRVQSYLLALSLNPLYVYFNLILDVKIYTHLIERTELVSGEKCVTVCIAVSGIQCGRMMYRQREECDRQREKNSKERRILGKTRGSDK